MLFKIPGRLSKSTLHPLIYTPLKYGLAPDLEKKKAELKTPHFLRLNQDIVASPQEEKCGLKYVIYIFKLFVRILTIKDNKGVVVVSQIF